MRVGGFAQVIIDTALECFDQQVDAFICREQDNGGVGAGLFIALANAVGEFEPVHFRHHPVSQDDIGRLFLQHCKRFGGAAGKADSVITGLPQCGFDNDSAELQVIYNDN